MPPDLLLSSPPPKASPDDAVRIVQRWFGLAADARPLTSERDLNFMMTTAEGPAFVLKIANVREDPRILDYQLSALEHVAKADPTIPVPRVMRAADGTSTVVVPDATGARHLACLLSFIPGAPLAAVPVLDRHPAALGSLLARLDRALEGFTHEAADRKLQWDLSHAAELRSLLPHVEDPHLRDMAERVIEDFSTIALPLLPSLRRQVIHNDLNPHNVIVGNDGRIAGIIDFGDMVRAALVNDLATAASYQAGRGPAPLGGALSMIAAYHAAHPLAPEEIELLPLLIATRTVLTVVITAWRASLYPENRDYILRNVASATSTLGRLDSANRAVASAAIRQTCS
jgi:Ser/Thr protein kinase RdoA (MazF antagonist)